ncbi:MAG: photosystem II reaction center protein Psb28 [Cyanobacteria bacterium P01_F01_bin.86]
MIALVPCVQIFQGVSEKVSSVSLRQDLATGTRIAVMRFQNLASLAHFLCSKKCSAKALHLIDSEGEILIKPAIEMLYGGPEGKDIKSVECKFEIEQDDSWKRFMRFIHRYSEAHGLACSATELELTIA